MPLCVLLWSWAAALVAEQMPAHVHTSVPASQVESPSKLHATGTTVVPVLVISFIEQW